MRQYLQGGHIELDDNLLENAIRPFALGRLNCLFICTHDRAQASADIYGLIVSAKANGHDPYTYLTKVIEGRGFARPLKTEKQSAPSAFIRNTDSFALGMVLGNHR